MTRTLTSDMQAALRAAVVRPIMLVRLQFDSTDLYLCDSDTDISWNAHTWLGNGVLQSIDNLAESRDLTPVNFSVTLAGEDSTIVSLVLSECHQNNIAQVFLALLNDEDSLIDDPFILETGFFDQATFKETGKDTAIVLAYENELIASQRAVQLRYTDQCQQALFPGDLGFQYVSQAADFKGFWGTAARVQYVKKRHVGKN